MNIKEIIDLYKMDEDVVNIGLFQDKKDDIGIIIDKRFNNHIINLEAYTLNGNNIAYMDIMTNYTEEHRFHLGGIYCYDKFRGRGIATYLSEFADYILKDYTDYIINGYYFPTQMSTDRINAPKKQEELDLRALAFYKKNGYIIITQKEYEENPYLYPKLIKDIDFPNNEYISNTRIFKRIIPSQDYKYTLLGDILIHDTLMHNETILNQLFSKNPLTLTKGTKENTKIYKLRQ